MWVAVAAAALLTVATTGRAEPVDPPFPAEQIAGEGSAERTARAARVDQASKQLLDETYQAELPRYRTGSGDAATRSPRRQAGDELGKRRAMVDVRDHEEAGGMASLMSALLWGMVIVIAVLGGVWLASELSKYGGDAELPSDSEARVRMQAERDAIIDRPLGDADELARRGRFAEAIHIMLLRTLQELARSAAVRVAPATTSREILARVPLLADARSALAGLITAVEITHFGDEPASAADYERCRQQFHVFAAAFRSAGQPVPRAVAA